MTYTFIEENCLCFNYLISILDIKFLLVLDMTAVYFFGLIVITIVPTIANNNIIDVIISQIE